MLTSLRLDWKERYENFKQTLLKMLEALAFSNLFLGLLIAFQVFGVFHHFYRSTPPTFPPEIKAYHISRSKGIPRIITKSRSKKVVSASRRKLASSFLTKGGAAMNNGNYSGAVQLFRQAISLDPNNQIFHSALSHALRMQSWSFEQGKIDEAFRTGSASQAWQIFETATRNDSEFFFFSTPALADHLLQQNQIASAVAILITYCRSRPKNIEMKTLLLKNYYWARQPGFLP